MTHDRLSAGSGEAAIQRAKNALDNLARLHGYELTGVELSEAVRAVARALRSPDAAATAPEWSVEVWNGDRKVTVYNEIVLRVWGPNMDTEMLEAPRSHESVGEAFRWLFPSAAQAVAATRQCPTEIADLRHYVIELRDWKAAVLNKCKASDGFDALEWGGDKEGWGFIHYFIGHLETRALHAETVLAEQDHAGVAQRMPDRDAIAAIINDRTMINDEGFVQNSEAVADAILALSSPEGK